MSTLQERIEAMLEYIKECGCEGGLGTCDAFGCSDIQLLVDEINRLKSGPTVVTLCGSSRFKKQHEEAQRNLTLEGKIVIPMGMYGHLEGIDMDGEIKKQLDVLHFRKIDKSHEIFVVNPMTTVCEKCGNKATEGRIFLDSECCYTNIVERPYIGYSTKNEIAYAKSTGKAVRYLNPVE